MAAFQAIERSFVWQARLAILLVGMTGLYMIKEADLWDRFSSLAHWWMHAMVGVWAAFAALLFVIEPSIGNRTFHHHAESAPETTLARMRGMHAILLAFSLAAIVAAVAGSHGLF